VKSSKKPLKELAKELERLLESTETRDTSAWRKRARDVSSRLSALAHGASEPLTPRPAAGPTRQLWVRDQLIVAVRNDAISPSTRRGASAATVDLVESLRRPFRKFEREGLIEEVVAVDAGDVHSAGSLTERIALGVQSAREHGRQSVINLVRLVPGAALAEVRSALEDEPTVEYVERVPLRKAPPVRRAKSASQWNLAAIGSSAPRRADLDVAVLDTGIDETHPAIAVHAYHHGGTSAEDIVGHGTHVAGILAGKAGVKPGWHGVADTRLHIWKIFGDVPSGDGDYYVDEVLYQRALRAALRDRCKVVNLSIGGYRASTEERRLIKDLVTAGVCVVAAMGNDYEDGNPTEYPAALDGVVAVGAVDRTLARASFSNTGDHIALVAPGVDILSTLPLLESAARTKPDTVWAAWDGTSMAAPHVAAAAAILLAQQPTANVRALLSGKAKKLPAMGTRPWTRTLGAGLLQL
jgi:subtilisin family serine protease